MARTFKFNQDNLLGGISNTNELNSPYNEVKDCNNVMFNISKGVERRNPTILSNYGSFKNSQNATNLKDACRCPFVYNPDVDYYKEFEYGNEKMALIIFDTKERYDIEISSEIYNYLLNMGGEFAWSGINLSRKMSFYDFKKVMENLENASSGSIKNYYYSYKEKFNGVSYSLTSNFIRFFPVLYNVRTGDIISSYSDFINYELKTNPVVVKHLTNNEELKKYHITTEYDELKKENIYGLFLTEFSKTRQIFSEGDDNKSAKKTFSSKISNDGNIYIINKELKTSKNATLNSEQYFKTLNKELLSKVSKDSYKKAKNYYDVFEYKESNENMYGDSKEERFFNTIRDRTCEILKINKVDFDTRYEFNFRFDFVEPDSIIPTSINETFWIQTATEDYYDEQTNTYASDLVNTKYVTKQLYYLIDDFFTANPILAKYYYLELKNDCIYIYKQKYHIHNIMKFFVKNETSPDIKAIFDKYIKKDNIPELDYAGFDGADGDWNSYGYSENIYDDYIDLYKNSNNSPLHSSYNMLILDHFALFSNIESIEVNNEPIYGRSVRINDGKEVFTPKPFSSKEGAYSHGIIYGNIYYGEQVYANEEDNKFIDRLTNTFTIIKPSFVSKHKDMIAEYEAEFMPNIGDHKMRLFGDIKDFTTIDQKIIPDGYNIRVTLKEESERETSENGVLYFTKDDGILKETSYITSAIYILKKDNDDELDKNYIYDYLDYTDGYINDGVVVFSRTDKQNIDIVVNQEGDYCLLKTPQEPNKSSVVGFDKEYPDFIHKKIKDIEFIENRLVLFYENSVYFSETAKYGSWFNLSSLQVFQSDPIQVTNLKNKGANFENVYSFLNNYIIMTDSDNQIAMSINGVLEVNNILFSDFSDYKINKDIGIKTYNNKLFFIASNKSGHSILYNIYQNSNGVLQTKTLNDKIMAIDKPYKDFYIYDNNIIIQLENKKEFFLNTYGYNYDGQKEIDIWTKLEFSDFDYLLYDEDYMYLCTGDNGSERFYLKNYRNSDENKPKLFVDALTNQDLKCFRVPSNITNWDIYNYQYNPESNDDLEYNTNEIGLIITKNNEAYKSIFDKSNRIFLLINGYEYKVKGMFKFEELKGTVQGQVINNDVNESFILLIVDVEYEDLVFDKKTYNSKYELFTSLIGDFSEYTTIENITIGRHYDSFFELNRFFITDRYSNQKITYGKTNILECGFLYEDTNSFNISVKTDRRPDEKITKMSYKPKIGELEPDPKLGIYNKIDNSLFNVKIKSSNKDYSIKLYNNSASNFVIKSLIYKINFENK